MEVLFFKDGRKTNTIEQFATDNDGTVLLDERGRKVVEKQQVEFKTILFELPVHENKINFDAYARGSKFHIYTEAENAELTSGRQKGDWYIPSAVMNAIKTLIAVLKDFIDNVENKAVAEDEPN